jgi:hypothetical protein
LITELAGDYGMSDPYDVHATAFDGNNRAAYLKNMSRRHGTHNAVTIVKTTTRKNGKLKHTVQGRCTMSTKFYTSKCRTCNVFVWIKYDGSSPTCFIRKPFVLLVFVI